MKKQKLMQGNNIELLKKLPDNSIDSVVTDPPYGLSFMGKKWDYDVPSIEFWQEVYRVLKPGGHILSFGGTRTYHRMVVNIEDAGFEIRDQIQWIYASGFPKSLNIQKQLEKNEYIQCECSKQNTEYNLRSLPETNLSQTINIESEQGKTLHPQLSQQNIQISKYSTDYVRSGQSILEGGCNTIQEKGELQGCNIQKSTGTSERNGEERWIHNGTQNNNGRIGGKDFEQDGSCASYRSQSEQQSSEQFGTMADERATQKSRSGSFCNRCGKSIVNWEGWGSALKPANEPICLARKPLSEKSIAENVLKWKTGGINVDGCRIESPDNNGKIWVRGGNGVNARSGSKSAQENPQLNNETKHIKPNQEGRFPANLILDESAAEMLDEQSGVSKSSDYKCDGKDTSTKFGQIKSSKREVGYIDKGGASRFFYVAKVSKAERNMGLDGFEENITNTKGHGLDRVCMNEGCGVSMLKPQDCKCDEPDWRVKPKKNSHPTVKPVNLMSYLCKLVTPPNGIVLDPFMGSGSTGIAALLNDFRFVGMEMDPDYFKIAEARINDYEDYRKFLKK